MNNTNDAHELQEENSRGEQRTWKDRVPDGQLLVHDATFAQLCSPGSPPRFKLQDMNMQVQESQKLPNEW